MWLTIFYAVYTSFKPWIGTMHVMSQTCMSNSILPRPSDVLFHPDKIGLSVIDRLIAKLFAARSTNMRQGTTPSPVLPKSQHCVIAWIWSNVMLSNYYEPNKIRIHRCSTATMPCKALAPVLGRQRTLMPAPPNLTRKMSITPTSRT